MLRIPLVPAFIATVLAGCAATAPQPPSPLETHIHAPQFTPPQSGITVQRTFRVVPQSKPAGACIAVEGPGKAATLLLSRRLLEELKARSPNAPKDGFDNRMVGIHAERAGMLLELVSGEYDEFGCARVLVPVWEQPQYLLGALLSSGQVVVIENKTGKPVDHILVTYSGKQGVAGHVHFTLPEDRQPRTILSYRAWVS